MRRHGRRARWYHWIIKDPDAGSGHEGGGHGERIRQARRAVAEERRFYRQISDKKDEVEVLTHNLQDLRQRNHFSELLAEMLKRSADAHPRGQ